MFIRGQKIGKQPKENNHKLLMIVYILEFDDRHNKSKDLLSTNFHVILQNKTKK